MNQMHTKNQNQNQEACVIQQSYNHDLQLYKTPPRGTISFSDLKELAFERQRVLELVYTTSINNPDCQNVCDVKKALCNAFMKENLTSYAELLYSTGCTEDPDMKIRKKDHISHFLLRLTYCQQEENLIDFFISQEVELFKYRYTSLNQEGITKFLATSKFKYSPIAEKEKEEKQRYLLTSLKEDINLSKMNFYKIPFAKVVDLVSDRALFVHKGYAYVPESKLVSYFVENFRQHLIAELEKTKLIVLRNFHDSRTQNFFKALPESCRNVIDSRWENKIISLSEIYELADVSYPLCMRIMHESLLSKHKLKYKGRIQYGLFLKDINVSLENGFQFWKDEFTKHPDIDDEVFRKKYAYHFRYSYGKEGSKKNFKPKTCKKLIESLVGPGEFHGCPFKHMEQEELIKKLKEYKIHSADAEEITRFAARGFFTLACHKYFRSTHENQSPGIPILHPYEYFKESQRIHMNKQQQAVEESIACNSRDSPVNIIQTADLLNSDLVASTEKVEVVSVENLDLDALSKITKQSEKTIIQSDGDTPDCECKEHIRSDIEVITVEDDNIEVIRLDD